VRLHVDADNTIRTDAKCNNYEGHVLGRLDRVESR
jgi:hypothetical protein